MSAWWAMPGPGDIPAMGERCDHDGVADSDDAAMICEDELTAIEAHIDAARSRLTMRRFSDTREELKKISERLNIAIDSIRSF